MEHSTPTWIYVYSMKDSSVRVLQDTLCNWTDFDTAELIFLAHGHEAEPCVVLGAGCSMYDAMVDSNFFLQRQARLETCGRQFEMLRTVRAPFGYRATNAATHLQCAMSFKKSSQAKQEEEDDAWSKLSPRVQEALEQLFYPPAKKYEKK